MKWFICKLDHEWQSESRIHKVHFHYGDSLTVDNTQIQALAHRHRHMHTSTSMRMHTDASTHLHMHMHIQMFTDNAQTLHVQHKSILYILPHTHTSTAVWHCSQQELPTPLGVVL